MTLPRRERTLGAQQSSGVRNIDTLVQRTASSVPSRQPSRRPGQGVYTKLVSSNMEGVVRLLQIRYHPNFKSQDTLLFAGSRDDIDLLRSFFLGWNGEELDLIKYLQVRANVYLLSVSALCLRRDMKREFFIWSQGKGTWLISQAHQEQIIGLLDGLLEAKTEGHQYLDNGKSAVQIMVSMDEQYPLPTVENGSADS
jgi:hypothetical protein